MPVTQTDAGLLAEVLRAVGSSAPVVVMLWWLLRSQTEERRETGERLVGVLQGALSENARAGQALATTLVDLAEAVREAQRCATREHDRLIAELQRVGELLAVPPAARRRSGAAG